MRCLRREGSSIVPRSHLERHHLVALAQRILKLPLRHARPASNPASLSAAIELGPGRCAAVPSPRSGGLAASSGPCSGVAPAHGSRTLAAPPRPYSGFAFAFLLPCLSARLLAPRLGEISLVLRGALVLRGTRFFECNSNGLPPALNFAAPTPPPPFQFAMFELVHDAPRRLALAW